MDDQDYRLAALQTWRKAEANADPDLARHYRSLAHAYLALARFRDRTEQQQQRPPVHVAHSLRGLHCPR